MFIRLIYYLDIQLLYYLMHIQESQPPTFLFCTDIPIHIALPGRLIQSHTLCYILNIWGYSLLQTAISFAYDSLPYCTLAYAFPCQTMHFQTHYVMIHPNYFSPPLDHCHPWAPLPYQHHQYLSLFSHYPSSLQPHQDHLCKWTQPMYHYRLQQREPQITNYGYPLMPLPSTSRHSSFICNLLDNSTTVKLSEKSPLAQSAVHYASPSQLCSTYPFPLMLILDPPPLWMPSVKANHIATSHVAHPQNPASLQPDHSHQKLKSPTVALLKEGMLQTTRTLRI